MLIWTKIICIMEICLIISYLHANITKFNYFTIRNGFNVSTRVRFALILPTFRSFFLLLLCAHSFEFVEHETYLCFSNALFIDAYSIKLFTFCVPKSSNLVKKWICNIHIFRKHVEGLPFLNGFRESMWAHTHIHAMPYQLKMLLFHRTHTYRNLLHIRLQCDRFVRKENSKMWQFQWLPQKGFWYCK